MSRLARNEFIKWTENQDHEELNRLFVEKHQEEFDSWLWSLFEDSLRGNE